MLTLKEFDTYINRNLYRPKQEILLNALNIGIQEADISTPLREAMFLAQVTHETGGFRWFEEFGSLEYFRKYDERHDLGNSHPGDGYRYKGRGFIQITGRANYTQAAIDLQLDLVHQPALASGLVIGARIAAWFWTQHNLNIPSDEGDIIAVTKKINGGVNGLADRIHWYDTAKSVLV